MLLNVTSLPGVADPLITDGDSGEVAALGDDILGKSALLGLVLVLLIAVTSEKCDLRGFLCIAKKESTYVEDEDGELGLLAFAEGLTGSLDILLELLDGVLKGGAGVIDLINDEDALADKVLHGTKGSEVEPLGAGNLGTGLLNNIVAERLVERETDGLDGDVGRAGALEERAQDTGGNVATTANGDHELGVEGLEDLGSDLPAQVVHLIRQDIVSAIDHCLLTLRRGRRDNARNGAQRRRDRFERCGSKLTSL